MPVPVWLDIAEMVKLSHQDPGEFGTKFLAAFTYDYVRHERPDLLPTWWGNMMLPEIRDLAEEIGDATLRDEAIYLMREDSHKNAWERGLYFSSEADLHALFDVVRRETARD
jgi:hypothetical protein